MRGTSGLKTSPARSGVAVSAGAAFPADPRSSRPICTARRDWTGYAVSTLLWHVEPEFSTWICQRRDVISPRLAQGSCCCRCWCSWLALAGPRFLTLPRLRQAEAPAYQPQRQPASSHEVVCRHSTLPVLSSSAVVSGSTCLLHTCRAVGGKSCRVHCNSRPCSPRTQQNVLAKCSSLQGVRVLCILLVEDANLRTEVRLPPQHQGC